MIRTVLHDKKGNDITWLNASNGVQGDTSSIKKQVV